MATSSAWAATGALADQSPALQGLGEQREALVVLLSLSPPPFLSETMKQLEVAAAAAAAVPPTTTTLPGQKMDHKLRTVEAAVAAGVDQGHQTHPGALAGHNLAATMLNRGHLLQVHREPRLRQVAAALEQAT